MDINVSAEEMIDELMNRIANLEMELAGARVIIRKLQGSTNGQVPQDQSQNGSQITEEVGQS